MHKILFGASFSRHSHGKLILLVDGSLLASIFLPILITPLFPRSFVPRVKPIPPLSYLRIALPKLGWLSHGCLTVVRFNADDFRQET